FPIPVRSNPRVPSMRDFSFRTSPSRKLSGRAFTAILSVIPALLLQSCLLGNSGSNPAAPAAGNGYFTFAAPLAGQGFDMDSSMTVLWSASEAVQRDPQRLDLYSGSRLL